MSPGTFAFRYSVFRENNMAILEPNREQNVSLLAPTIISERIFPREIAHGAAAATYFHVIENHPDEQTRSDTQ